MSFPTRISRLALGPIRLNRAPVTDHEHYLSAEYLNLLLWQLAGMNACASRAFAVVSSAGLLLSSGEAWDPNSVALPTTARASTGVYTVSYAAQYANHLGELVTLDLVAADVTVQGVDPAIQAAQRVVDFRTVEVVIKSGGTLTDAAFLCEVW
jgi:hypothetical protein